jgi:pimeloyl-ACP methyl ester carboxylesterase
VTVDWLPPDPLKEFNAAIPDIREAARAITAPTLVITGRDDFICGPAAAAEAAEAISHREVVCSTGPAT